jgi:UDP-2-acetamido-3-amino-2,3-dideoxy-glucuronate N-acetyltransferase
MHEKDTTIYPGAFVSGTARIYHKCTIREGSTIGDGTSVGSYVYVDKNVQVGNGVKIQNFCNIVTGVVIEDNVFIGPSVVFTNVINPRAFIERKDEFLSTVVGYGATIGAGSTIVCGNTIGNYALIGAGSVVTKDVEAHSVVAGNPAKRIGWITRRGTLLRYEKDPVLTVRYNCGSDLYCFNGDMIDARYGEAIGQ